MAGQGIGLFDFVRIFCYVSDPRLGDHEIHRVRGEPARVTPPGPPPAEIKVATWNIERGARYDRILEALGALDADVYLLQEVDTFCRRSGRRNVARDLAHALGMNWVSAGEFQEIGQGCFRGTALTGQAVLSRHAIVEATAIRFSAQAVFRWRIHPLQPRRGGRVAIRARTAGLLVYNTHMESRWSQAVRRCQLEELVTDAASNGDRFEPVIIGGDFNAAPATEASMFGVLAAGSFTDALAGIDGRRTTIRSHPVDWIYVKNLQIKHGTFVDTGEASDHDPVLATLALQACPSGPRMRDVPAGRSERNAR